MPSILSRILDNVAETLADVSPLEGFDVKLVVMRPRQLEASPFEGACVLTIGDAERDYESMPETLIGWAQPIHVACYALPAEADQTPIDTRLVAYAAAVEQKLLEDVTRGGLAWDTIPVYSVVHYGAGAAIVQSTFHVMYRYLYGDPSSLG